MLFRKNSQRTLRILLLMVWVGSLSGQKLPDGAYNETRPRTYDILHYKATLTIDIDARHIAGRATVELTPLQTIDEIRLDAIRLQVTSVEDENDTPLSFQNEANEVVILLDVARSVADTLTLSISYRATPSAGMYFMPDPDSRNRTFVTTYGEDGLHANWLPIYSGMNDRFSTEMIITVPEPYMVVSNGALLSDKASEGGKRTFHWLQTLPHPTYLISLYVGDFEKADLSSAFGEIPLSYWVPKGKLEMGAYAFRNTTHMLEYFTQQLDYPYRWDKYDQIAIPDYAIGAMEHTSVTGHRESILRTENAPVDFSPTLTAVTNPWSAEAMIAHELAHHWFGNAVTCKDLSYIWLNESFASFLMMLWDEASQGKEAYLYAIERAKKHYFDYVHTKNIIRPLEYHHFDDSNSIYNTEHTYYKGAVVLHMLRTIMGDEPFFRTLSYYLHKHEFSQVESNDLKVAFQEAVGENLSWFFEDWVTGGGHPQLRVTYQYSAPAAKIALDIDQVQPIVEGMGLFTLPIRVTIRTSESTITETVWIKEARERFLIDCKSKPLMLSIDGEGDLVAEIDFPKTATELAFQALYDAVPGRLRAIRQLAKRHPQSTKTIETFREILNTSVFWGIKAEAALMLGAVRRAEAEALIPLALQASDYRIRKAAVLALPEFGPKMAEMLRKIIDTDPHSDVVATALLALADVDPDISLDFLEQQLSRDAWYDEIKLGVVRACEKLNRKELLPLVKKHASLRYNQFIHGAAIDAWRTIAPDDPELHDRLLTLTASPAYQLQQKAITMLGELYVLKAEERLEEIIAENADRNLVVAARTALDKIRWMR